MFYRTCLAEVASTRAADDLTCNLLTRARHGAAKLAPHGYAPSFSVTPRRPFCSLYSSLMYLVRPESSIHPGEHNDSAQKLGWSGNQYRCAISLYTSEQSHIDITAADDIVAYQSRLIKDTLRDAGPHEQSNVLITEVCRFLFLACNNTMLINIRSGEEYFV